MDDDLITENTKVEEEKNVEMAEKEAKEEILVDLSMEENDSLAIDDASSTWSGECDCSDIDEDAIAELDRIKTAAIDADSVNHCCCRDRHYGFHYIVCKFYNNTANHNGPSKGEGGNNGDETEKEKDQNIASSSKADINYENLCACYDSDSDATEDPCNLHAMDLPIRPISPRGMETLKKQEKEWEEEYADYYATVPEEDILEDEALATMNNVIKSLFLPYYIM
jgi:hypothetical protein